MKLPETIATENELLKQRVRFMTLINGYLSVAWFVILAYAGYHLVKALM